MFIAAVQVKNHSKSGIVRDVSQVGHWVIGWIEVLDNSLQSDIELSIGMSSWVRWVTGVQLIHVKRILVLFIFEGFNEPIDGVT